MKIAIVGSGLAGLTAAVDLVDEGHEVEIYENRSFWGGKVGSWEDKDGNHIEMGLHVFFYNYANLFKLMKKVGALDNLLPKEHTHLFIMRYIFILILFISCTSQNLKSDIDQKVDDIISQMTLEEKVGQMTQINLTVID